MHIGDLPRRLRARPAWGCAAIAVVFRTLLVLHAWDTNPFVRKAILDAEVYLGWAREIAAGDIAGRGGFAAGQPWVLNPLYAYVIAPFVGWMGASHLPILVGQALLGAATVALTAAAATRFFGRGAGWIAGLATAFSAVLCEMDAHVAVTGLATFLIAGACFACAPPAPGDRKWAHGPVAAAIWLGIGALARPVTVLALPLVAWRFAREAAADGTPPTAARRVRTLAVAGLAFLACAVPSLLRNWTVTGDATLYTSAGGINAYLGNNPDGRAYRQMVCGAIHFHPVQMHTDAKRLVAESLGHVPTRAEISSWFWAETLREIREHPGDSAAHYGNKLRWFFGPTEIPSSASLAVDRSFSPRLAFAFVPTWLLAALAAAGLWAHRRRWDVLLGPGALVAAHVAILTLVFPLSHYRAPAIPAMAVLAAGAVAAVWAAKGTRAAWGVVIVAGVVAAVGAVPPGPDPLTSRDEVQLGTMAMQSGRLIEAEDHARRALSAVPGRDAEDTGNVLVYQFLGEVLARQGRWDEALVALQKALDGAPDEEPALLLRSWVLENLRNLPAAEADARRVAVANPESADAFSRLATILSRDPRRLDEARKHALEALRLDGRIDPGTLRRLGLPQQAPR